ncbi:hypothetical protein V8C86DRAFT_2530670 [Haematococcus lacustris]
MTGMAEPLRCWDWAAANSAAEGGPPSPAVINTRFAPSAAAVTAAAAEVTILPTRPPPVDASMRFATTTGTPLPVSNTPSASAACVMSILSTRRRAARPRSNSLSLTVASYSELLASVPGASLRTTPVAPADTDWTMASQNSGESMTCWLSTCRNRAGKTTCACLEPAGKRLIAPCDAGWAWQTAPSPRVPRRAAAYGLNRGWLSPG